jgi:hypothetical protein
MRRRRRSDEQRAEHDEGERERQKVRESVCEQQREADSSCLRFLVKTDPLRDRISGGYQVRLGIIVLSKFLVCHWRRGEEL